MITTDICAEYWLRPHSDECPGLPCWDVPPNQTHHAPVTVAAYSSAHHPQSPRQGGLPHKYFLFTAAATQSWLQNCINYFGLFSVAPCGHLCASQLWFPTVLKCEMSIHLCPQEVPRVNVHYFHWCLTAVLKLLRSPGKDCPRFSAMMTETFESHPYQKFLKAHQVRQRPSPHSQTDL